MEETMRTDLDRKIEEANKRNIFSCLHNKSVSCDFNSDCEKCGWFPEERERRIAKLKEGR